MNTASWGTSVLALAALTILSTSQPAFAAPGDIVVSLSPTPKFKSMDGKTSASIIGFIQAEAAFNNEDTQEQADGTTIRRARLGIVGKFGDGWGYKYLHDFGNDAPVIQDAYLTYNSRSNIEFKVGQFKEMLGLEYQGAVTNWQFMELSLTDALTSGRSVGASLLSDNHDLGGHALRFHLGVFGDTASETNNDENEGYAVDLNTALQLIKETNKHVHVGVMASYRVPRMGTLSYNAKANSATGPTVLDTGDIVGVDMSLLYGLQGLAVMGPASAQAEYVMTDVNRSGVSNADVSFSAAYVQASYFLTGETRGFNFRNYGRSGLTPSDPFSNKGGTGAFEVAGRYEILDLNDGAIKGGKMQKATLGLNWYPNDKVRFQANYSLVQAEVSGKSDDDPQILMLRAQVGF